MAATQAAITAYRKGYFNQELDFTDNSDWADRKARLLRYAVLGQYVNGNPYDKDIAKWANKHKADHGLYEHTRPIANPAYQLAEFYKTHVWGGWLDPSASANPDSALPIETENEKLREHIAKLWQWSNWTTRRNTAPFYGAAFGDVAIQVVDDVLTEKVYLKIVHPSKLDEFEKDAFGNIKAYRISYQRTDDQNESNKVEYTETAERDGDNVLYRLYKNGSPYAWDGSEAAEWEEPYGFIPMVHIQHRETPYGWGEAEIHPRLALVRELDDQQSLLNDQIRKTINAVQIVKGETANSFAANQFDAATDQRTQPMREDLLMIFLANPDSSMDPMVADLPIDQVVKNIEKLERSLESDYPELALKRVLDLSQASGAMVRRVQRPAANKVESYRDVYDGDLVKVVQMGISIGGYRGLFDGITLESFAKGELDFTIGKRPVFDSDPMDDVEIKKGQSEVLSNMSNVGNLNAAIEHIYGENSPLVGKLNQVETFASNEGEPVRDGGDFAGTPETLTSEKGLNGAQIRAAIDLLAGVTDGTVAELNAVELLTSLGIAKERAERMAQEAKTQEIDTGPIDR